MAHMKKDNYVEATTAWCSRRCELNGGMPCQHMLHACVKENMKEVPLKQFSGFWFWREEPEVKPHIHVLLDDLEEEEDEEEGATPMRVKVDMAREPIIPAGLVKASNGITC